MSKRSLAAEPPYNNSNPSPKGDHRLITRSAFTILSAVKARILVSYTRENNIDASLYIETCNKSI